MREPVMPTYDIKLFPLFGLEFQGVEADTPESALRKIQEKIAFCHNYLMALSEADPLSIVLKGGVTTYRVEERGTETCQWIGTQEEGVGA
jgi:hypothetical protein